MTGPLVPYVDSFGEALLGQGYTPFSARSQLELMAHVSRWLATSGLCAEDLTPTRIEEFLDVRRAQGHTHLLSPRGLVPLLEHLRCLGVVPASGPVGPVGALERLLLDYERYLLGERGLASSTAQRYVGFARRFLTGFYAADGLVVESLTPARVSAFVLRECSWRTVGSAKCAITRLRCLLRFLHVAGRAPDLAWAVPSAPSWRLTSLPRGVDRHQVARLLASCDRRTGIGRRDFAVLTVLVRLGLRCGEVAGLELGDLGWRAGEVLVRGKGRHEERLPLPADVGEAVAKWLRRGRPRCECPKVFTRMIAPCRGLTGGGVSSIVVAASARAGLPPISAHRLRHTAATEMLRGGAGLGEVGQVLRHKSHLTTAIYAKVDHAALSQLARPWPGGAA